MNINSVARPFFSGGNSRPVSTQETISSNTQADSSIPSLERTQAARQQFVSKPIRMFNACWKLRLLPPKALRLLDTKIEKKQKARIEEAEAEVEEAEAEWREGIIGWINQIPSVQRSQTKPPQKDSTKSVMAEDYYLKSSKDSDNEGTSFMAQDYEPEPTSSTQRSQDSTRKKQGASHQTALDWLFPTTYEGTKKWPNHFRHP